MSLRRTLLSLLALSVVVGLLPTSSAMAARNKPPKIRKAVMKDRDGDGKADRVVLRYNEKIKHKVDRRRFPFKVAGYRIKKINGARGTRRLVILLRESSSAPLRPASISYKRTRKQPVKDMRNKQARKQFLTRNIIGLVVPAVTHTLTVQKGGDGLGVVTSDPAGIDCGAGCEADYDEGTPVTLTATPDTASGATFAGWTGCASSTDTCTVTMDAAKTVGATFTAAGSRTMTVSHTGDGTGAVTSSPAGIDCGATCAASYAEGTPVTLTATPDPGSKLAAWGGDATCPATSTTCVVPMTDDRTVSVTFELLPLHSLTVTNAGTGTGTVSSGADNKISCAPTCNTSYPEGTVVTLTATPDSGSTFGGWSGDATCGASETCDVTVDAAKNVIATFDLTGGPVMYTLTVTPTGGTVSCVSADEGPVDPCDGDYADGDTVTITAEAGDGMNPLTPAWTGCDTELALVCTVTMDADKEVTVTFEPLGLPLFGPQL